MPRSNLLRPHDVRGACRSCFFSAVFCALVAIVLGAPEAATAQEALLPGQAFVTQFSGTTTASGTDGVARTVIDVNGASGVAIDLRAPGFAADGRHWRGEPHLFATTAGDVGQVFGVALDDAPAPNIYLTATALFGLHRNLDNSGWMEGMWGRGGGPGTVYKLNAANGYQPEVFAEIALNGRPNSGAALGNIAFDRWNRQFYVSDLETGMIHRLGFADGADLGQYDHGVSGRSSFFDAVSGVSSAFAPVAFDPATAAHIADCPTGDFARTVSCWNMADFRRRVFGLGVRRDATTGEVRLYYSVWGSQGFGNLAWASAGDDQKNTLWSVAIGADGDFDLASVRREAVLPDFFVAPEDIARSGYSHPVADIAFPAFGDQTVMLLAERGGVRNLGLSAEDAFATPHEARVLRYEIDAQGVWQPVGRYDVGFYDRQDQGTPYIRANAAGGVAFGFGYDAGGAVDLARPNAFVWMTGDALCSPAGPCFNPATDAHDDQAEVHGIEGRDQAIFEPVVPDAAFQPYPAPGPATPASGPDSAIMVDSNVDFDAAGNLIADLGRNDATRIGDIAIYQIAPDPAVRPVAGPWYGPWQESWPWPVPEGGYPPLPPPPAGGAWPELALEKTAPPQCAPTDPCTTTITATNNGPGVYEGPLHVLDTPGGLILTEHSAGWTCEQPVLGGGIGCRSDWITLAPRESVALELTLGWPGVVVADGEDAALEFHNCGFIVWPQALEGAARIRAVEAALLLLNIEPGPVDGVYDADTQDAIDRYRAVAGLPPGEIDDELLASLFPGASSMAGDGVPDNDWSCAPIRIPLGPGEGEGGGPGEEPEGLPEVVPFIRDLEVTKELAPGLCRAGATCTFVVNVTNLTEEPYEGPVVIYDQAEILDGEPLPDGLVNPVVAELNCDTLAGEGVRCAYADDLVLDGSGGLADFVLRVTVPEDMAGQTLHNCARIDWDSMAFPGGSDINGDNDRRCADVAFDEEGAPVEPPAEPEVERLELDLTIEKSAPESCRPGGLCVFRIQFLNNGPGRFDGPLAVYDYLRNWRGETMHSSLVSWSPNHWQCENVENMTIRCRSNGSISLEEGESEWVNLVFEVPADYPEDLIQNQALIDWDAMELSGDTEAGASNDIADAVVLISTEYASLPQDLAVFKSETAVCHAGRACRYEITVQNNGPDYFAGPIVLDDVFTSLGPGGGAIELALVEGGPEPWRCEPLAGAIVCRHEHVLLPLGRSTQLAVTVLIPDHMAAGPIQECVNLDWPAMDLADDPNSGNDRPCIDTTIVRGADIGFESDTTCTRGESCTLSVRLRNFGDVLFEGTVGFVGTLSPPVPITSIISETPGLDCSATGDGAYECLGAKLVIPPGEAARINIQAAIPADFAADAITHTKDMVWPDAAAKDYNPGNDQNVSTITIEGPAAPQQAAAPDLAVDKVAGQGSCVAGQVCPFVVTVTNIGVGTYVGPIRIADVVAATNATLSASEPSRWSCRKSGATTTCTDPSATLAPGESTRLSLSLTPPRTATGSFNNCASLAWNDTTRTALAQNALNQLGFDAGPVDGKVGPRTHGAVHAFEERAGLPATAQINQALLQRLFGTWATGDANAANDEDCAGVVLEAAAAPTIVCDGGSVSNNQCVCPTGTESQPAGPGAFRCVATTPSIQCGGGKIENNRCICPQGMEAQLRATNVYKCVQAAPAQTPPPQEPPTIRCSGGSVENNQCVCPQGMRSRKVSDRVYRCVTVAPSIQCGGGKIENNRCICPQGTQVQLRAPNIYKCVPVAPAQTPESEELPTVTPSAPSAAPSTPSITCQGGNVQNNQCVCGPGKRRNKFGTNAYRCVPIVPGPLQRIIPRLLQR